MKFSRLIIIFIFILFLLAAAGFSQEKEKISEKSTAVPEKPNPTPENKRVEPMREGERLTFMQKNEASGNRSEPESGSLLLKTLGAMFLIVGLIFGGAWGLKKLGFGNFQTASGEDPPELAILSSVSPKNGQTISVIKFGSRTLLVGSTAQSFTLLAEADEFLPADDETDGPENPVPRSVAELLAEENLSFQNELEKARYELVSAKENGGSQS